MAPRIRAVDRTHAGVLQLRCDACFLEEAFHPGVVDGGRILSSTWLLAPGGHDQGLHGEEPAQVRVPSASDATHAAVRHFLKNLQAHLGTQGGLGVIEPGDVRWQVPLTEARSP